MAFSEFKKLSVHMQGKPYAAKTMQPRGLAMSVVLTRGAEAGNGLTERVFPLNACNQHVHVRV